MKCPVCKGKARKPIRTQVEYRGKRVFVNKPNPCPNCKGRLTVADESNNTGFELATIETWPLLFTVRNNYRERTVTVYNHPTDTELLITVGKPFDGGGPAICWERKSDWRSSLARAEAGQRFQVYN